VKVSPTSISRSTAAHIGTLAGPYAMIVLNPPRRSTAEGGFTLSANLREMHSITMKFFDRLFNKKTQGNQVKRGCVRSCHFRGKVCGEANLPARCSHGIKTCWRTA
jgi:hypothetical protein